jgi:hypothetical protein
MARIGYGIDDGRIMEFYQMLIQINCSAGIQRSYYESREAIDDPNIKGGGA